MPRIEAFTINISEDALDDLHQRLDRARWPDQLNDQDWSYGTDLNYLKELVGYWRNDFDWKKQQAALNSFAQFRMEIDGQWLHYIHQQSPHAHARPLLICHGWPGSIAEFLELIPRLTEPEKFGGKAEDACHVICPSLPGYAFSDAATETGMNTRAMARKMIQLMAGLDYPHYLAQGGDWGAMITRHIADLDPDHCEAIHLNMVLAFPPEGMDDPMSVVSDEEKKQMAESQAFMQDGMGYFQLQSTRPQTLGYALQDSPLGLCAWLTEKYRDWTDCEGEIRNCISWDQLLTIISLYWFTDSICSSTRIYYEERHNPQLLTTISLPTGAAVYPKELVQPPRAWAEATYPLVHYSSPAKGGHFAALEQPQIFAEDLWLFFHSLKTIDKQLH